MLIEILKHFFSIAILYFTTIFLVMGAAFGGIAKKSTGISSVLSVTAIFAVPLLFAATLCVIADFVLMIKLKKDPLDEKIRKIREKTKKAYKTLLMLYVCFSIWYLVLIVIVT